MLRHLVIGVAAAALAGCAAGVRVAPPPADPSMASPPRTELEGYLAPGDLDGIALIGPPPAAGSPRAEADRAAYLASRSLDGSPRWTAAQKDNDLWYGGAVNRYACAAGVEIGPDATPRTWRLLQRVELDTRTVGGPAKQRFNRTRPMIGDDQPICIPREDWMRTNGSYPSGHANVGWAWGLILAEMKPERATALVEAGREVGESRLVCGVHYPSDVEAGRTLGSAMVARLHADTEFERDLAAAKAELARSRTPPAGC